MDVDIELQSNLPESELNPLVRKDCMKYQIFIFLDMVMILEIPKLSISGGFRDPQTQ